MCVTCGCGAGAKARIEGADQHAGPEHVHLATDGTLIVHSHGAHVHAHGHDHAHGPGHAPVPFAPCAEPSGEIVRLETALLDKNQRIAERNRAWLAGRGVLALNLMSSPGAGKTSLLVRTLTDLREEAPMLVVEGDQETSVDAQRIRATGARAVQINTGTGCHLEADMLERALRELAPPGGSVLFVENVGNLVCPALFDLGEAARVIVLSVTEGEDKPLKYPHMFRSAHLLLLTKMDLWPYVSFDADRAEANAREINPELRCLRVSATSGAGLADWYAWLRAMRTGRGWGGGP
jgi:hydrogenase nickel incorporation protein HypB